MSTPAKPVAEQVVEPWLVMVMSILPSVLSGAAFTALMDRSFVLQNVTLLPVFVALFAPAAVSLPESDFALLACAPLPEPDPPADVAPPSDFEAPSEDEAGEEVEEAEDWLEDESLAESPLLQAVSERAAARLMVVRAAMRMCFMVSRVPVEGMWCVRSDVFVSPT